MAVPKIMALAIPWKSRKNMRAEPEVGKAQKREDAAKIPIPRVKNLFLPQMSAALPRGTMKTAIARRWEVTTHPGGRRPCRTRRLSEEGRR